MFTSKGGFVLFMLHIYMHLKKMLLLRGLTFYARVDDTCVNALFYYERSFEHIKLVKPIHCLSPNSERSCICVLLTQNSSLSVIFFFVAYFAFHFICM
jgi:hypothetical protein